MKLAFLADPICSFKREHDSTWALIVSAQAAGHRVFFAEADSLLACSLRSSSLVGAKFIELNESFIKSQNSVYISSLAQETEFHNLDDFDFVFMRKDPPINELYIQQLRLLTLVKKTRVINNPRSLLHFNEKLIILEFPDLIAATLVSSNKEQLRGFLEEHKRIVLKPLNGKGGEGIFVLDRGDKNFASMFEQLSNYGKQVIMAQAYIPAIESEGDKRIIMLNGEPLGALLRQASSSEHRANMAAGGSVVDTELNSADLAICATLKDFCQKEGIYLAGIDVIGGKLTEINISSPTCLQEIARLRPQETKIADLVIENL